MIEKVKRKNKCNKCMQISEYLILIKKQKNTSKIYLCGECLKDMYFEISRYITPKSPRNILNKFNQ